MAEFVPEITNDYLYMVFSNAKPGQEAEYVRWELEENSIDMALVPGFMSTRFYEFSDVQLYPAGPPKPKYMNMYHFRAEDPAVIKADLERRYASGELKYSPAMDETSIEGYNYHLLKKSHKATSGAISMEPGHPDYLEVMFDDAVDGQDADMDVFYEEHRMPQLMEMPQALNGYRGLWSEVQLAPPKHAPKWFSYFAFRTDDISAANPLMTSTPAPASLDRSKHGSYTYKALNYYEMGHVIRAAREAAAAK
ncbi:MAG: hypothetical protein ABW184_04570 [Sphingobium sp.]